MNNLKNDLDKMIEKSCISGTCNCNHDISVDDVVNGISHLKHGKNDGNIGQCSDHVIYGTDTLHKYISYLFSSMLCHGYSPDNFVVSTIVSIPKNKHKSLNDSENYRGIALSSILGKIFDWIILLKDRKSVV